MLVAPLFGFTDPFRVAVVFSICDAAEVVAEGAEAEAPAVND